MLEKNSLDSKFETVLFLPIGENKTGEGGLRTKGHFKKHYDNKLIISIITVVFNGKEHLEETILSVLNQTYDNIEYIIIDGASTDGTLDIIKKYEDKIDYWVSEKDKGIYDAMNKGINLANGEWLNFMNAGDKFYNDDTLEGVLKENIIDQADCIYSNTIFSDGSIFVCDIKKNRVIHQALIYKKDLHKEVGSYVVAKGVTISDYLFFMLSKNKRWVKVSQPIAVFDLYGASSNLNHFKQKIAVDLIFNNCSRLKASLLLLIHPFYNKVKRFFK